MNLDGQLQQIIEELLAHGISLDLAKKEFEKKYIVGAVRRSNAVRIPFCQVLPQSRFVASFVPSLIQLSTASVGTGTQLLPFG